MSVGYIFVGFWNEFIRFWVKLDIKVIIVLLLGRFIKWSIFEYFVIEYIYYLVVFIKYLFVYDNGLGIKIIGEKVNDLELEIMVVFIFTRNWI